MGSRDLCNKNSKQKLINELECVLKYIPKNKWARLHKSWKYDQALSRSLCVTSV